MTHMQLAPTRSNLLSVRADLKIVSPSGTSQRRGRPKGRPYDVLSFAAWNPVARRVKPASSRNGASAWRSTTS